MIKKSEFNTKYAYGRFSTIQNKSISKKNITNTFINYTFTIFVLPQPHFYNRFPPPPNLPPSLPSPSAQKAPYQIP